MMIFRERRTRIAVQDLTGTWDAGWMTDRTGTLDHFRRTNYCLRHRTLVRVVVVAVLGFGFWVKR